MKLGKLPARLDSVKLKLSDYTSITPPPKAGHQNLDKQPWLMLGNDNYGDCVWAGAGHETMHWNAEAGKTVSFSDKAVLSDYSAVTGFNPNDPNSDQGTDMQVAASYRLKTGVTDGKNRHKIGAYVAIQGKNELKQAIYLFGAVGVGIQFPASAMNQFNAGKPWSVVKGSQIEGGHYIPAVGYDSRYVYVVTWGKLIKMTWGFFSKYCDEAIAYLSPEFLTGGKSLDGLDLPTLQQDVANITKAGSPATKGKSMQVLQARWKAVVALLGGVLNYLYLVQQSNPNHYVALAILVLTVLGVHQVPNKG